MQNTKLIISVVLAASIGLGGGFWYGYKQGSSVGAKKIVGEMIDEGRLITRQGSATSSVAVSGGNQRPLMNVQLVLGRVKSIDGVSLSLEIPKGAFSNSTSSSEQIKKVLISGKTDITKVDLSAIPLVRSKDQGARPAEIKEVKAGISELKNGAIVAISTIDDLATKTEITALKIQLQNNFPKDKLPQ